MTPTSRAFALPDRLAAKSDPALIAADERHFAAVADALERALAATGALLEAELSAPGGSGQKALDRDLEVHRLEARLRALRRFGLDLCLGCMIPAGGGDPVYIGRFGLSDDDGRRLLVDWRTPAAEPFFGATHAEPRGLASRRRYRWTGGRVTDYWDEVFTLDDDAAGVSRVALDDQSAFIASLGSSRSSRMRDVLSTIQADQDAIIRATSRGALVVDGGPGTGKTVVALHRTAYLLHADARLAQGRGGVLVVGPSAGYLAYVDDVLPSLGEETVQTCTLRDLVPEGRAAGEETDARAASLKASARMQRVLERAVRYHEVPPTARLTVTTEWADVSLDAADWEEAFGAVEPGTPHNEGREQAWEELLAILVDRHDDLEVPPHLIRRALLQDDELVAAFGAAWPVLDPAGVLGDLWSVPAYLRICAPWLDPADVEALQRAEPRAWTVADLPLLGAARSLVGDPTASSKRRRRAAALAAQQDEMTRVVDELIAADAVGEGGGLVTMLRVEDAQRSLVDDDALPGDAADALAGPFAHVVVDEAQELTDAEWLMLVRRCPSRSLTIVGDRAQARHGFAESWAERLARVGLDRVELAGLSVNYRTPAEIMAEAEPVIRSVLPDANVPTSIRSTGVPVEHASLGTLDAILDDWLAEHDDGLACVITADGALPSDRAAHPRIRVLTPALAKGLEFDLVLLIDPDSFGTGIEGAVDRYVAMTRATHRLVLVA